MCVFITSLITTYSKMAGVMHVVVVANHTCWDVVTVKETATVTCSSRVSHSKFNSCSEQKMYYDIYDHKCSETSISHDLLAENFNEVCRNKRTKHLVMSKTLRRIPQLKFRSEGRYFSVFLKELQTSKVYRRLVLQHFFSNLSLKNCLSRIPGDEETAIVWWTMQDCKPNVIDYEWCLRMNQCAQERQHLGTLMSWLSTLGGACSALGDCNPQFAERAGDISMKQLKIGLRLGDPNIVSRCRLYAAISLIQQCKFKVRTEQVTIIYFCNMF